MSYSFCDFGGSALAYLLGHQQGHFQVKQGRGLKGPNRSLTIAKSCLSVV